ncbi:MAG: AsmA-like C-terminal region-containing protein, partial [Chthoniobacteraceae bacterium]
GDFSIAQATLHGQFSLSHLSGVATRAGKEFQIRKLAAEAGGGSLGGEATWIDNAGGSLAFQCSHVDLARASQDAGAAAKKIAGMLDFNVQLAGLGADSKATAGKGTLALRKGNCAQFEVLRQIGDVLRVASLANFEIADAAATFQIAGGQIVFAPVEISAPPVGLTLNGPAAFDGPLNLTASLHAPADLVARQPLIAPQFSPPDAASRRSVPFSITGTFGKPRQNLAEKLTGTKDRKQQRIIAAEAIISALMDRKKPQPQQPAAVQPAPAQP